MNPIAVSAVGGIIGAVGQVLDDLVTTDKERMDAQIELAKIDASLLTAQMDVNKAEASHASIWVAGWRPACGWIGAAAMAYQFIIYPFMKRVTGWVHMFLGLAIAMAPAGGWVGVSGTITAPLIVLCTAVALWIGAFDAMYGAQDEAFDRSQGLHSLAVSYGAAGAFRIATAAHVICILCFLAVGFMMHLSALYFVGVLIAAGTLCYQHRIVSPTDFSRVTQRYFMRNGIVSVAIFACTWLSFYI